MCLSEAAVVSHEGACLAGGWIQYVFHENTNAARVQGVRQGAHDMEASSNATPPIKAKVRPPRLGDRKVGLFATRTPHRPNPIGLSLVRLDAVQKYAKRAGGLRWWRWQWRWLEREGRGGRPLMGRDGVGVGTDRCG